MKTILLITAVSFSYSYRSNVQEGSGKIKEEIRNIQGFNAISVEQSLRAQVSPGPFKVRIKGDDNVLPFVETAISKGVLRLKYKEGVAFNTKNPVEVFIQAPHINSIQLTGASSLTGKLGTKDRLDIDTSGGSHVTLSRLDVKNLEVASSGASNVTVEQFVGKSLTIDSSGGCSIAMGKLNVKSVNIDASGASYIALEGSSEKVDIDVSGGARLNADQLKAKDVIIDASGASETQLKSAKVIKGDMTGGSAVHVAKSAQVDINRSTASRLVEE